MKLAVRLLLVACVLVASLPIVACSDNSTEVRTFDFTIDNQTNTPYQVFQRVSAQRSFTPVALVVPGSPLVVRQLTVGPTYTFRVSPVGGNADEFLYQFEATSTGGNLSWTFN
jgi:hypothetical protein